MVSKILEILSKDLFKLGIVKILLEEIRFMEGRDFLKISPLVQEHEELQEYLKRE